VRAFGGVQSPATFCPDGAVPGAAAWPFNVNPFAQRPCERALCTRSPATARLAAAELRTALVELCGGSDSETLTALHPGVSVLGYMGAPHAPVVRTFLDALTRAAEGWQIRLRFDPEFSKEDSGAITILESHPAVSLAFYASAGAGRFPQTVEKYKPWRQNGAVFEELAAAVTHRVETVHTATLATPITTDDDLDAVVGLMNLLELAGGSGDLFGTAEDGYFLVPRVTRERSFTDFWRSSRDQIVGGRCR